MIRGTTPTITYNFPFDVTDITEFRMYFIQGKDLILTKTEEDCTISGNSVSVTLTQEETFLFSPKKRLETKARFRLDDGTVSGTRPKFLTIEDTGDEEVIQGETND